MTTMETRKSAPGSKGTFRHEALLYRGIDDFVDRTSAFIRDGVDAGEPVLVIVSAEKVANLRDALGSQARGVHFADMSEVGANPARIISVWYDFVAEKATGGRRVRGIGEPIVPGRSPEVLVECQRHESLLNLAFRDASAWWLLCPYDTTTLPPEVIEEALATHPRVLEGDTHRDSDTFRDLATIAKPFDVPLSEPPADAEEMCFDIGCLDMVRNLVARRADEAGLRGLRADDLVLAVHEVATNSVRHGGGRGRLRVWRHDRRLVCEVVDDGAINEPLAGRRRPVPGQQGGFGMWLVHQLCDLTQVRTFADGSVVRMHMWPR
jgi:anti-sigma regulatory factor (Ser/Thr protein kinase)